MEKNNKESEVLKENPSEYKKYSKEILEKSISENKKIVLFFHASWCPSCKKIDSEISSNLDSLPKNSVLLKVDYDSEIDLKKKYGITTQTSFVFLDGGSDNYSKIVGPSLDEIKEKLTK